MLWGNLLVLFTSKAEVSLIFVLLLLWNSDIYFGKEIQAKPKPRSSVSREPKSKIPDSPFRV